MNVYRCRLRRPFLLVFGRLGDDLVPSPSSDLATDSNAVIGVFSLFVFVCVGAGNPPLELDETRNARTHKKSTLKKEMSK